MISEGASEMSGLYDEFRPYVISRLNGFNVPLSMMEDAIQEAFTSLVEDFENCPETINGKMTWASKHIGAVAKQATIDGKSHLSGINPVTAHRVNKAVRDHNGDLEAASASLTGGGGGVSRENFYDVIRALKGAFYDELPDAAVTVQTDWSRVTEVSRAVAKLKPEQRQAITRLYGLEGYEIQSASALAREWGISEAAVRSRAKNALRNLEKALR